MLSVFRHRLASGTSEKIQLSSLIAAFQVARDLVAMEAEWQLLTSDYDYVSLWYLTISHSLNCIHVTASVKTTHTSFRCSGTHTHTRTTVLRPFLRDHLGEPVPEENFWTLWCKGRLTDADTDHPAGRHSIQTNQCSPPLSPHFFTGRMPFLPPNQQCQRTEGN